MNSCEERKCPFWNGTKCTDTNPAYAEMCRFNDYWQTEEGQKKLAEILDANDEKQEEEKRNAERLLIADLYACCRRMQMQLHDINAQTLCLETIAKEMKNPMLDKVKKNIEGYTECIYAEGGYLGFPPIVETIERAAVKLLELGETRHWSDYIGFDERMEDFEDQYGHLREKYAKIDAERKNESY